MRSLYEEAVLETIVEKIILEIVSIRDRADEFYDDRQLTKNLTLAETIDNVRTLSRCLKEVLGKIASTKSCPWKLRITVLTTIIPDLRISWEGFAESAKRYKASKLESEGSEALVFYSIGLSERYEIDLLEFAASGFDRNICRYEELLSEHHGLRYKLSAWTELQVNDQMGVIDVLVFFCQEAIYRLCDDYELFKGPVQEDVFGDATSGQVSGLPKSPTTYSLNCWAHKIQQLSKRGRIKDYMVVNALTVANVISRNADTLMEAVERNHRINKAKALMLVDCAREICGHVKGWKWLETVEGIREDIEDCQVEEIEEESD